MYCPDCGTDAGEGASFCPDCGRGLRGGTSTSASTSSDGLSAGQYAILSVGASFVSILFLPIVFGPLGLFGAYRVFKTGREAMGLGLAVFAGICMVIGFVVGAFFAAASY